MYGRRPRTAVSFVLAVFVALRCLAVAAPAARADGDVTVVRLESTYYAAAQSFVGEAGSRILDDITVRLQLDPDAVVVIDGYADDGEPVDTARRRALACRDYLVAVKAIAPGRIVARAFGSRYPAGSPEQNRHVGLALVPKGRDRDVDPGWERAPARRAWSGPARAAALARGDGPGPRPVRAVLGAGHDGAVLSVACSGDGRRVVTGGDDGLAVVWDRETGSELRELAGHTGPVLAVAFAADGRRVATASADGTASVWDPVSGAEVRRFAADDRGVSALAFSPDGRRLVAGGRGGALRVYDAEGSEVLRFEGLRDAVASVAFSDDGGRVVAGCDDGTTRVWDAATGLVVAGLVGHRGAVTFAAFAPGGRVVTAGDDGTARVWDAATGEPSRALETGTSQVSAAALAPDGRRLLVAGWGVVRAIDLESGEAVTRVETADDLPSALAFGPAGREALVALGDGARLVDASTGAEARRFDRRVDPSHVAAVDARGRVLLAGLDAEDSRIFELAPGRQLARLRHEGGARAVFVSPAGGLAAVLSGQWPHPHDVDDDGLRENVWRVPGGEVVERAPRWYEQRSGPAGGRYRLEISSWKPGGPGLEADDGANYYVVSDAASGRQLFWCRCLDARLTPDGERLVTRRGSGVIELRDPATGRVLRRYEGFEAADLADPIFLLGGARFVVAGDDRTVRALETDTGRLVWSRHVPPPPPRDGEEAEDPPTLDLSVTDDGRFVRATDGYGSTGPVRLLSAETGEEVWSYVAPMFWSVPDRTTPDGRFVLTHQSEEGESSTVRVVDARTKKEVWGSLDDGDLSPDGWSVLLTRDGEGVSLRETATGRELWRTPIAVWHAAFSGDGRFALASCGERGLVFLDAATGRERGRLAFFVDGSWVALDPSGTRWDGPGDDPPPGLVFVGGDAPLPLARARALREPRLLARLLGLPAPRR